MSEDCTPPSSPYRCSPYAKEVSNFEFYRPFDCSSTSSSDKNLDVHDELYLRKENSYLEPVTNPSYGDVTVVGDLFVYKSLDELATWQPVEELFRVCRMKLMMASSWKEPQLEVRQHLLGKLVELRSCVDRAIVDSSACETVVILEYFNQLCSLRLLLGYLPDIPDCMLSYVWAPSASAFPEAWYNLFHLHLDLRWYHLTCVSQLVRSRCDRTRIQPVLSSSRHIDEHFLEKQVVLLVSELLELAIRRFEKTALAELLHTTPYCCRCVEELWLMLQLLMETMQLCLSVQPFGCIVRSLLDAVQPRRKDPGVVNRSCSEVSAPDTLHCSNPTGFRLWIFFHVNHLGGYSNEGLYVGPASARVRSNYEQLSSILRSCLGAESSVTEEQLRVYLPLVKPLVVEWWELNTEPVVVMWEYFQCRLNSAFYVRGAPPRSVAIMSQNGCALLSQVRALLDAPPSSANSFALFLNLLGAHLRRGVREGNRRAWQQLKGRLYSKFSPAKMAGFSELGLYHFASLFLVLAITAEPKQVAVRCQELLGVLLNTDLDAGRRAVIWKTNIAFLLLHVEEGIDVSEMARPFLSEVGLNTGNAALMKMFIGDLQLVLATQQGTWGNFSQHILFDSWLVPYLSGAPPTDALPLLDMVLQVMERGGDAGAGLGACVLQFVKRQFSVRGAGGAPPQVCRLAVELTMLGARHGRLLPDSFVELFRYFGCSLVVDPGGSLQYLCVLLKKPGAMGLLASHVPGYTHLLVQSWIRCLLVCRSPADVAPLTQVVAGLPEVRQFCSASGVRLESGDDTFRVFVEAVGKAYAVSAEQDKAMLRETCTSYFGQVAKFVEPLLRDPPSYPVVQRVYDCVYELIRNCKTLLYKKNSPSNILLALVAQLFLPQHAERELHPHRATALRHHVPLLLEELVPLALAADAAVGRVVRQLVVRYLPVFDVLPGAAQHPLVQFFAEGDTVKAGGRLILQAISDEVLRSRGVVMHKDADVALAYVLQLTKQHGADVPVLQLIAELCMRRVFEIAMFTSEAGRHQSQMACNVVSAFLASPAVEDSSELRESFCAVLLRLCSDSLAFSMVPLFKLLSLVTTFQPRLVEHILPQLWVEVRRVESRRGVSRDPALRASMEKIEQAIKLKTGQNADR